MIEKIKDIQNEFSGLIPSSIVAFYLFDEDNEKAIKYLDSLVDKKIIKKLNKMRRNQYYRFYNKYENGILNYKKDITVNNIAIDIFNGNKEVASEYLNSFVKNGILKQKNGRFIMKIDELI